MDSYALVIESPQGKITFKSIKSKKEYQVINEGQGVSSEMYIKNDTLYTVAAGSCVGVGLEPGSNSQYDAKTLRVSQYRVIYC